MSAYFLDESYLKSQTAISGNVDVKELMPFISDAQDIYVPELIGSTLYNTLRAAVTAGTETADQITLLELIRKALAWYCLYKYLPFAHLKIKPKGVLKGAGEGTVAAELSDIQYLRKEILTSAEFHSQRVIDYLKKNCTLFPDYENPGDADILPKSTAYRTPIAFDTDVMSEEERDFYRRWLS